MYGVAGINVSKYIYTILIFLAVFLSLSLRVETNKKTYVSRGTIAKYRIYYYYIAPAASICTRTATIDRSVLPSSPQRAAVYTPNPICSDLPRRSASLGVPKLFPRLGPAARVISDTHAGCVPGSCSVYTRMLHSRIRLISNPYPIAFENLGIQYYDVYYMILVIAKRAKVR